MPITWVIDDLDFGSHTASGSFVYDADTNTYSDINVVTIWGVFEYNDPGWGDYVERSDPNFLFLSMVDPDNNDLPVINDPEYGPVNDWYGVLAMGLSFSSGLTNDGGVVSVAATAGLCADRICSTPEEPFQDSLSGSASAVPIPAAVWLFGSGLGLLGWFCRRQTA